MSKQLMMYNNIQPLSEKHAKWSVNIENYEFIAHMNSAPLLASEMVTAAMEYPIIFSATATEGEFIPLAVMGLKEGQNLFLNEANGISARYIPAFIRRYPFILGGSKDSDVMAICIDEGSSVCVADGTKGMRLFEENGEQSARLKDMVEFLKDYQYRTEMTRAFCKLLHELGLLEPMNANITFKNNADANINITGLYVVSRDKLKALSDKDLLVLFKNEGMELIFAHLQSLSNMNRLINIMAKQLEAAKV